MSIRYHTFDNGLRIVTEHMPWVETATVGIWVTAGGRNEHSEQNGIAHFLEHMAFKRTKQRTARDIAEAIENVGGYINAYTSRETTAYYTRVLASNVDLALDVIADIVLNPAFDEQDINTERGVILQEIGQTLDTPDDIIFDWLQETAYPQQAFGRSLLGPSENIKRFQQQDFKRFVHDHYTPGRMIIAAAGQIDHEQIVTNVANMGRFAALTAKATTPLPAPRYVGGERFETKDLEQVHCALAFPGAGHKDSNYYTAKMYAILMGGGMSSRLFQEVREKHGLCYSIFAQNQAYSDSGTLIIYAGTSTESACQLLTLIAGQMHLSTHTLTISELQRVQTQIRAGTVMGLESVSARAGRLARSLALFGRVPPIEEDIEKIYAVGVQDIQDFATQLVQQAPPSLVVYSPQCSIPTLQDFQHHMQAG